jgi:hypothetical protein
MHGRPIGVSFSEFIGQRLIQICFGEHQTQLHFDERCSVMADVDVNVLTPKGLALWGDDARRELLRLVGQIVETSAFVDDKTFVMKFDSGVRLSLHDDSDEYESFQISVNGTLYVI